MVWWLAIGIFFGFVALLAFTRLPLIAWTGLLAAAVVALMLAGMPGWLGWPLLFIVALVHVFFGIEPIRRQWVTGPAFRMMKRMLPPISETERAAIEAGTTWWEGEIFRGRPDWSRLLTASAPSLSEEEQAFLDGPVEELCRMLDDWKISHELRDLPPEVWEFLKAQRFFGMVIPKQYGGLEFSAHAHSLVLQKIASRSVAAAVTVMVPNSLGPAELLLNYGTDAQKDHYLPRLARGEEIPCFALTGPFAGSDAGSIPDVGVVCKGEFEGREVLGLRLNWEKRYITLGPVATVLGLAFRVRDPDHLLGENEDLGITCALIPTDTPGVKIGRRHDPLNIAFLNGPNWGKDVFIPLDWVIGGPEMIGQGWRMLIERLGVGRGISLPSLSVAAGKFCADVTGAYARVRSQFHVPIGKFEGVQEALARIAGLTYLMDGTERLTVSALDAGERPSVVTAMTKRYLTEGMRRVVNDAMDVHGGKAICMGPSNYLGRLYQSVPVGITVEGANILTRSLMVYGQGVMRCHPYLLEEMEAVFADDEARFDRALMGHAAYLYGNAARAFLYGLSQGRLAPSPERGFEARYYRQVARFSAALAAMTDVAVILLGGSFKRREFLSGRFADALAYLYMTTAVLKRFRDDGRPAEDRPLVDWACQYALHQVQQALKGIIDNFPIRPAAWKMRAWVFPLGAWLKPPSDRLTHRVAELLLEPGPARERLVAGIFAPTDPGDPTGRIRHAWAKVLDVAEIEHRIRKAGHRHDPAVPYGDWVRQLRREGIVNEEEARRLLDARKAVAEAIRVDDFPPSAFGRRRAAARRAPAGKGARGGASRAAKKS